MTDPVAALDNRVTRLENQIMEGFKEIKSLLTREIDDLKKEQLRDLRGALDRLADDQRRLWEAVGKLQNRASERTGGSKAIDRLWSIVAMIIGGALTFAGSWLSMGGKPPH
jgi:hypothetical protein